MSVGFFLGGAAFTLRQHSACGMFTRYCDQSQPDNSPTDHSIFVCLSLNSLLQSHQYYGPRVPWYGQMMTRQVLRFSCYIHHTTITNNLSANHDRQYILVFTVFGWRGRGNTQIKYLYCRPAESCKSNWIVSSKPQCMVAFYVIFSTSQDQTPSSIITHTRFTIHVMSIFASETVLPFFGATVKAKI